MNDIKLIQLYVKDINVALKDIQNKDVLDLFDDLYNKEQKFAKRVKSTRHGKASYLKFIKYIADSRGGIKKARSYFRIREGMYLNTVNKAISSFKPEFMYDVPVNFRFCSFIMKCDGNSSDAKLIQLFNEIKTLREEIISRHLYLALHRAKLFINNTSIEFEDLVQIANESLIIAVDKYVMNDDSSSFHSVAIGRMIADFIVNGTFSSSVSIGEHAQKKLYKIRKAIQQNPNINTKEIAIALDIAEEEINDLVSAMSYRSLDDLVHEDGSTMLKDTLINEDNEKNTSPESLFEDAQLISVLRESFNILSIVEQKVLLLKGVFLKDYLEDIGDFNENTK